jgi:hypothetical protein
LKGAPSGVQVSQEMGVREVIGNFNEEGLARGGKQAHGGGELAEVGSQMNAITRVFQGRSEREETEVRGRRGGKHGGSIGGKLRASRQGVSRD